MKIFSSYPGFHKVHSALAEYFWSLKKGRMWCYNILGNNDGSISYFYGFILFMKSLFY